MNTATLATVRSIAKGHPALLFATLMLGMMTQTLTFTAFASALPQMARDLSQHGARGEPECGISQHEAASIVLHTRVDLQLVAVGAHHVRFLSNYPGAHSSSSAPASSGSPSPIKNTQNTTLTSDRDLSIFMTDGSLMDPGFSVKQLVANREAREAVVTVTGLPLFSVSLDY